MTPFIEQNEIDLKKYTKLIDEQRTAKRFSHDQPSTPLSLIKEITDQIHDITDKKIAVMFTVEWALYLEKIGCCDITLITDKYDQVAQVWATRIIGCEYLTLDQVQEKDMKFDVVVGNPPFNNDETSHSSGLRKQNSGKNLSKHFFEISLNLSKRYVSLIASYSQRTYSKNVAESWKKQGLYKITNSKNHFDVLANSATFFFDKTSSTKMVDDEMLIKLDIPENNISKICFPRATHNGLARNEYEHTLNESGSVRVVVTTGVQKYTNDISLVTRMGDRTRGKWRVVFNKVSDKNGIGKLIIAGPDDLLTQNVGCFVTASENEAIVLKSYLEQKEINVKIGSLKISNANSKNVFQYIENPLC